MALTLVLAAGGGGCGCWRQGEGRSGMGKWPTVYPAPANVPARTLIHSDLGTGASRQAGGQAADRTVTTRCGVRGGCSGLGSIQNGNQRGGGDGGGGARRGLGRLPRTGGGGVAGGGLRRGGVHAVQTGACGAFVAVRVWRSLGFPSLQLMPCKVAAVYMHVVWGSRAIQSTWFWWRAPDLAVIVSGQSFTPSAPVGSYPRAGVGR